MADLEIKNLHVRVEDREILKGVDLDVSKGEMHALMGPNGSGKSTLANTIMGHPGYEITEGRSPSGARTSPRPSPRTAPRRACSSPSSIRPPSPACRWRTSCAWRSTPSATSPIGVKEFGKDLKHATELLHVDREFTSRHLNDGFSGGEKKRARSCRWRCSSPRSRSSTRPTRGWTSTRCAPSPRASTRLHDEQSAWAR